MRLSMMKYTSRLFAALLLLLVSTQAAVAEESPQPPVAKIHADQLALLQQHCVDCHGADNAEAGFRVDTLPLALSDVATAARWQKVLNALNSGEMPPEGEPELDKSAKADFLDHLANVLVDARDILADQGGVITMRRLNRREYKNTLRELLGVDVVVADLPSDRSSRTFDTDGSSLYMSSTQFEQYMALAREAINEAREWEQARGVEKSLRFETEEVTEKVRAHIAYQIDAKQRATEWTTLVDEAVADPENAEIVARIKAGPLGSHRHIFYRNWKQFPDLPAPEEFGFRTNENNADKAIAALNPYHQPYHEYYLEQPAVEQGAYFAAANEHPSVLDTQTINLLVPFSWPVGDYVVRFRAAKTDDATPDRCYIEFGLNPRSQQAMSAHEITGTMDNPQIVEFPLKLTRANKERAVRSMYLREKGTRDDWDQATRVAREGREQNKGIGRTFSLWVDWFEIERVPEEDAPPAPGLAALSAIPLTDPHKNPSDDELRGVFKAFASEAFRGADPTDAYIEQLVQIYRSYRSTGSSHQEAYTESLAVILSSPMFLYLSEPLESHESRSLTDRELAIRLSYFLWGSPPDKTLLELARQGVLSDPDVLAAQTTRLLDDPRSRDFVDALTYQWLGLERLDFFQVNLDHHPRFDNSTRFAAKNEIYETVNHLVVNNAPLSDLLNSDYVIINGVLANYYGIDGVDGDYYRKVTVPEDSPRGGLLGMASVHLMGSNGDHTSPVERGAWVLRKLLNDPPPPAPANVPQLARLSDQLLTTEQRLTAHQEDPQCASCHRKIDPIGFGLENFDAVGAWRTEDSYQLHDDNGKAIKDKKIVWTIDPAVKLHNGPAVNNYFELRDAIATHQDDFARGCTEALIQYALGRRVGFTDERLITDIMNEARGQDYAIRSFIHALVNSQEFQSK